MKHPEIKKQLGGGHLWNPSYFVATVSDRTLEQMQTYIENQKTNEEKEGGFRYEDDFYLQRENQAL